MKRRARQSGEGSVYQRKDGRWLAAVTTGWEGQRQQRKTATFGTREQAHAHLVKLLRDRHQGLPITSAHETLGRFLLTWLENTVRASVRPSTYTGYEGIVRLHIIPALGRVLIEKLTPAQVQSLLTRKHQSGLSPRTVQYIHTVLRRALGQAERWGLVARNVAKLVDPPRRERRPVVALTPAQARALLRAVEGDRLAALYSVAIGIGLRRGEALGLSWAAVDLDRGTILVEQSLQRAGGELRLLPPKTASSRRTIHLPATLVSALREHRIRQLREKAAATSWQESGLVFTTRVGGPIEPRNLNRHFYATLTKAGLPHFRLHDLRHSAASIMLSQGIDLKSVSEILGHSGIQITADLYTKLYTEQKQENAERMDRFFGQGL